LEAKQAIKEGRDSQPLLPAAQWKKKGRERFIVSVKTPNGTDRKLLWKVLQEWLLSVVPRDENEPPCLRDNKTCESRQAQVDLTL
jgi:hypothetical protein